MMKTTIFSDVDINVIMLFIYYLFIFPSVNIYDGDVDDETLFLSFMLFSSISQ